MEPSNKGDDPALRTFGDGEEVHSRARVGDADVVVTSHRLVVASVERTLLDVPIDSLRRIQFDIERQRPATLVIVPEEATHEPQVLAVPPTYYKEVADALVIVGQRLAQME